MPMGNTARKIIVQQTLRSTGARRWANWITPPPSPALRQRLGLVLTVVGVVLTLGLIAGILVVRSVSMTGIKGPLFMFVALVVCGPMLLKVYRYTRRVRAEHALEALKKDHRAPLLLLRAFRDDYYPLPGYVSRFSVGKLTRTFEEYLYDNLSRCGPVIAIGRPGERTPPLRALRFWVADDKWKMVVEELLSESQYVLMIMGNLNALRKSHPSTPSPSDPSAPPEDGLTWEVRRVFALREMHKIVLLMPPVEESEAQPRWEQYRALSQYRLPPYQGGELGAVFATDGAYWVVRAEAKGWFQKGYRRDKKTYDAVLEVPR